MNQMSLLLWGAIIVLVTTWSITRLHIVETELSSAEEARSAVTKNISRVQQLRQAVHGVALHRRDDGDLISRVQQALSNAGLPISACSGVQPRPDVVRVGSGLRVQSVQMTLRRLSPDEFGTWLAAWRSAKPAWQLQDVQLTRVQQSNTQDSIGPATGNRYDVAVVLAAPFIEESP